MPTRGAKVHESERLMRLFIAIELPQALQEAIHEVTAPLREALDRATVRWVPVGNVHLTLKFLGEVTSEGAATLKEMLSREAEKFPAFDVEISGAGAFPSLSKPHVIWVGLQAPPALVSLRNAIELACERLGYPAEEQNFSPHLTIGRVRRGASAQESREVRASLESRRVGLVGTARIEAVHLFRSELRQGGSVYTRLHSARLSGPASLPR